MKGGILLLCQSRFSKARHTIKYEPEEDAVRHLVVFSDEFNYHYARLCIVCYQLLRVIGKKTNDESMVNDQLIADQQYSYTNIKLM